MSYCVTESTLNCSRTFLPPPSLLSIHPVPATALTVTFPGNSSVKSLAQDVGSPIIDVESPNNKNVFGLILTCHNYTFGEAVP